MQPLSLCSSSLFFFHDTATTEIYTLSLHDALPISVSVRASTSADSLPATGEHSPIWGGVFARFKDPDGNAFSLVSFDEVDRKSTRLNSSHTVISYAVFCLKKKKKKRNNRNILIR